MKKEKGSTRHILESEGNFKYVLIMEGLACGLLAGLIAIIYRLLLGYAEQFIAFMASVIWDNLLYIIGWFLFLLVLGVLIGWCLKQEPLIRFLIKNGIKYCLIKLLLGPYALLEGYH